MAVLLPLTGSKKVPNSPIEGSKLPPHPQEAWTEEEEEAEDVGEEETEVIRSTYKEEDETEEETEEKEEDGVRPKKEEIPCDGTASESEPPSGDEEELSEDSMLSMQGEDFETEAEGSRRQQDREAISDPYMMESEQDEILQQKTEEEEGPEETTEPPAKASRLSSSTINIIQDSWERRKKQRELSTKDLWKLLQAKWNGVDSHKRQQWHEIREVGGVLKCTSWTAYKPKETRITNIKVEDDGSVLWGHGAVKLDTAYATNEKIVWKNPKGTDWHWSHGW